MQMRHGSQRWGGQSFEGRRWTRWHVMLVRYLQFPMLASLVTFAHVVPTESYPIPPSDDSDKSLSCEAS